MPVTQPASPFAWLCCADRSDAERQGWPGRFDKIPKRRGPAFAAPDWILDGMFGEVRRTCDQTLTVLARKEKQRQQAERQELLDSLRAVLSGAASKSTSQRLAAEYIPA